MTHLPFLVSWIIFDRMPWLKPPRSERASPCASSPWGPRSCNFRWKNPGMVAILPRPQQPLFRGLPVACCIWLLIGLFFSFPRHSFETNWQPARIEDARSISATVFCLGHVVVLWLFWGEQTSGLMMEDSWKTCRLWDEVLAILGSTFQSVSAYNMLQWYYI